MVCALNSLDLSQAAQVAQLETLISTEFTKNHPLSKMILWFSRWS
jgi:hypothetical protein